MSLEAIKRISEAEENAIKEKLLAQQKAKSAVEEAERQGRAAVASAIARAESEIAQLKRTADATASENAIELASTTANRQAALRVRAGGRLERAAELIVERIVDA